MIRGSGAVVLICLMLLLFILDAGLEVSSFAAKILLGIVSFIRRQIAVGLHTVEPLLEFFLFPRIFRLGDDVLELRHLGFVIGH